MRNVYDCVVEIEVVSGKNRKTRKTTPFALKANSVAIAAKEAMRLAIAPHIWVARGTRSGALYAKGQRVEAIRVECRKNTEKTRAARLAKALSGKKEEQPRQLKLANERKRRVAPLSLPSLRYEDIV